MFFSFFPIVFPYVAAHERARRPGELVAREDDSDLEGRSRERREEEKEEVREERARGENEKLSFFLFSLFFCFCLPEAPSVSP